MAAALRAPHPPLSEGPTLLREWTDADAPARRRMLDDPQCARWLPGLPRPYTEKDARQAIARGRELLAAGAGLDLAIVDVTTGDAVGGIQIVLRDHGRGEIGVVLAREARGRGVATRALRLLSRWALTGHGLARLELPIPIGNDAAVRVAARAGYYREGVLRSYLELHGERVDVAMWSLLPPDLIHRPPDC